MDIAPEVPVTTGITQRPGTGLTWRAGIAALVFALAWLIGWFATTATAMVGVWARSETFMHGFLIAPISAWLIWRLRHQLKLIVPRPGYWALLPIFVAGILWLIGQLSAVNALSQFAFVAMLVMAVPLVLGWSVARAITFPLAFLFFMVPFGEFLLPPLMEGTANFTVEALRASGVPVYREGLSFVIPSGRWSVVEACSGVRYLIASLVAGSLYAYLNYQSTRRRLVFFAFSIGVPIVANWVRAYLIVMLGHLSNNKIAVGVDHLIYGWLFFGVVLLLLFWIGSFWSEPDGVTRNAAIAPPASSAMADPGIGHALPVLAAFAVGVAVWPLAYRALDSTGGAPAPVLAAPGIPESWTASTGGLANWSPRFLGAPAQMHATYAQSGGVPVGLYIGYYRNQADGRKLISTENALVASEDPKWVILGSAIAKSPVTPGPMDVRETLLKRANGSPMVAWQWYWIDGKTTSSEVTAKLYALRARLAGRGDDGAVVILTTLAESQGGAREVLASFLRDAYPAIDAALKQTRDRQ